MITCPQCETEVRDGARYCHNCATPLVEPDIFCPDCGTSNPPKARFCLHCATPLQSAAQQIATAPSSIPPAPMPGVNGLTGQLMPGITLSSRYTILRKLGRGGMGSVYLVTDNHLGDKSWAIKELSTAMLTNQADVQPAVEAFRHEAMLLAALNHTNLTRVTDYFEQDGKHYLVMDYINGNTLAELLEGQGQPFPEAKVLDWAIQLCDVLGYLHGQNPPIIFRDLKPANIMEDLDGRLRLIDFGIARLFKPGQSRDTANFGTSGYAPPEQYGRGQSDARSDLYALGVTLHHLLTLRDPGDEPFKFPDIYSLNPAVTDSLCTAIAKAVNLDPADRWQSATEFKAALTTPKLIPVPVPLPVHTPSSQPESPSTQPNSARSSPVSSKAASSSAPSSRGLCPHCGVQLTFSRYCPQCGKRVPEVARAPSSKAKPTVSTSTKVDNNCPHCQAALSRNYVYCPVCGKSISGKKRAGTSGSSMAWGFHCPHCNTKLTEKHDRCPSCGEYIAPRAATPSPYTNLPQTPPIISRSSVVGTFPDMVFPAPVSVKPSVPKAQVKRPSRQPAYLDPTQGIEMVTIPSGTFLSGERKVPKVLPEYQIARFPVTNAVYKLFLDANPHIAPPRDWSEGNFPKSTAKHPVVWVSYEDALAFCKWGGLRLPTEEEWEKAARGTNGRVFPWGDKWAGAIHCNCFTSGVQHSTPVDAYPSGVSTFGVWDMAGNIWEWTATERSSDKFICKGGSWLNYQSLVIAYEVSLRHKKSSDATIGFRVARDNTS